MMKPIENPIELNCAVIAQQGFGWARSLLLQVGKHQESESRAVLFGAVCVYYARAFTNNRGLGKLLIEFATDRQQELHDDLVRQRDKVAAHSDLDHTFDDSSVSGVYFRSSDGFLEVENRHMNPAPDYLVEIEKHIDAVMQQVSKLILACLNTGEPSRTRFPNGLYKLSSGEGDAWKFEPVDDDGLDGESDN